MFLCGEKKNKEVLMVFTERKTLQEIIRKIKSKSQYYIIKELDKLERETGAKKIQRNI